MKIYTRTGDTGETGLFGGPRVKKHSPRVEALASGQAFPLGRPEETIEIPADFTGLLKSDRDTAKREQLRVREEFLALLSAGLICCAFDRNAERPKYFFYREG